MEASETMRIEHADGPDAGRLVIAAGVLVCGLFSSSASAQIAALVSEPSENRVLAVRFDSETGVAGPSAGLAAIDDCCLIGAGLTTLDPAAGRFLAYGRTIDPDTEAALDDVVLLVGFDGSTAQTVTPARIPQGFLAFDAASGNLISAELTETTLQLFSLDPASGAASDIGLENDVCCSVMTGMAAVDSDAGLLYFIGREFGQTDWAIQVADLSNGVIDPLTLLPSGSPAFLSLDADAGHLDLYIQNDLDADASVFEIDTVSADIVAVATEDDGDCCLLGPGAVASEDERTDTWWLAGRRQSESPGFVVISSDQAVTGAGATPVGVEYRIHAMAIDGEVIDVFRIFSDRFE
jgi:hypothetical protein